MPDPTGPHRDAADLTAAPAHHPVPDLTDVGPHAWREANRRLLAKALGEWCFEAMLKPVEMGDGSYRVDLD
ncbi:MAG: IucA/IucC family protein, partial [Haloechinothrix sp.]